MPSNQALPKNWPPHLPYLTQPTYSKTLTPAHHLCLKTEPSDPSIPHITIIKGPSLLVKITPITIPTHPAFQQCGLFATKPLLPGTFILQYLGDIHITSPEHAESNYDLSLDRYESIGIDADKKGNEARFINDYRGVAEKANAEFREIWDEGRKERGIGVWVLGEGKSGKGKGIKKGEEILVSYGRGFWGARKEGVGG